MRKPIQAVIAAGASLLATSAMAAPELLGSITHLYGTDAGRQAESIMGIYHSGGNCDALRTSSVTVQAKTPSSCNRFADAFDFSGINFDSIAYFTVTLDFSGAKDQKGGFLGLFTESWYARGGYDYVHTATNFGSLNASGLQTLTFSSSQSNFNAILNAKEFYLSFGTDQGTAMKFDLASARLDLYGTPAVTAALPEPASLALVGLSLVALGGVRRAQKKRHA